MEDPVAVNENTNNADNNILEAKKSETLREAEEIALCEEQMTAVDQKPTDATDEETCSDNVEEKSLSMATSDDNTCTTLRLDTVMNIKSKSEDFTGEEKKDDSDEPAVIEEPIEEMPVASVTVTSKAKPKAEHTQMVNKVPETEPAADEAKEDTEMTEESDESLKEEEIVIKESTIEEACGVVAPIMFNDFDDDEEEEEKESPAAPATEETTNNTTPTETFSMDSDRPTEEAQVTTKPTTSMDSEAPAGEADITTKSTSMSEVHATDETIVSKKSSGDSSLVQAENPPTEKASTRGFFSCGAPLCGRMSDVVDSEPVEAEEIKTTAEDISVKSEEGESTETPTKRVTEETSEFTAPEKHDVPDEAEETKTIAEETSVKSEEDESTETPTEIVTEETSEFSAPEKDAVPDEETAKEGEEKDESKPDITAQEDVSEVTEQQETLACPVEQQAVTAVQEKTAEVVSDDVALNEEDKVESTIDVIAPEDTKDDDILLEGPRMIDIANMKIDGTSFDVQEGYSCSTIFNFGGSSAHAKTSATKKEEVDVRMTLSQDLIMEAREEGEKELEERSSKESLTMIAEDAEETTAEQPSPVEPSVESKSEPKESQKDDIADEATTVKTTDETTFALEDAPEEEPKEGDIPSEQPKEEQAVSDKSVAAEVVTTTEQLATDVEEQPEKKSKEEDATNAVSVESSSSLSATPGPENPCEEVDASAHQTEEKEIEEVGTVESAKASSEELATQTDEASPSTKPEKPVAEQPLVEEETLFKAQQEAYACGNGACTIL